MARREEGRENGVVVEVTSQPLVFETNNKENASDWQPFSFSFSRMNRERKLGVHGRSIVYEET